MIRHLLASGDYLTECSLTVAIPASLMTELEDVTCDDCRRSLVVQGVCPECGEKALAWSAGPVKLTPVVDGRLTMRDVETQLYLGCESCSETLISGVTIDQVLPMLNETRWRP